MDWKRHFQGVSERAYAARSASFGGDTNVAAVQAKLNAMGYKPALTVDGLLGPKTRSAIARYQARVGLPQTGNADAATLAKLGIGGAVTPVTGVTIATLPAFPGLRALPATDLAALVNTANAIGIDPAWLATIIDFETAGTFSPSIQNAAGSGAVGLIQFMPSTAKGLLGTATENEATQALAAMSFAQQLELVKRYFAPYAGKIHSLEDAYLAVLYPAFIGKANDAVLGQKGSAIYDQNAGFDISGKGYVTKEDITQKIRQVFASVTARIPVSGVAVVTAVAVGTGMLAWLAIGGAVLLFATMGQHR
jgi:peptidoglycan hydrolase-like protein with peptidoglycan-binding domain